MREAVIVMVIIDIIVLLPTLKKIWIEPSEQMLWFGFTTALFRDVLNFVAVSFL